VNGVGPTPEGMGPDIQQPWSALAPGRDQSVIEVLVACETEL
jgi:hypothetical protein